MTTKKAARAGSPKNDRASVTPDGIETPVRTRFSGVLISLPSEGPVDVEGDVRYSAGLMVAFMAWSRNQNVREVSPAERAAAVAALADEIQRRFAMDRSTAETFAANLVRVVDK